MSKQKEKVNVDALTEAKNALRVYETMKQSVKFFEDMVDYHIKHAKATISRIEKAESEALNSDENKTL